MGKKRKTRDGLWAVVRLGGAEASSVEVRVSPAALWAVAGLVGTALLGSAGVVAAARRPAAPRVGRLDRGEPPRLALPPTG